MADKPDTLEVAKAAYRAHRGKDYKLAVEPGDPPAMAELAEATLKATYGASWCRPGLDLMTRSIACMSITASLGLEEEFKIHARIAQQNGMTKDEMVELLFTFAGYLGVPRTGGPRRWMREVWKEAATK